MSDVQTGTATTKVPARLDAITFGSAQTPATFFHVATPCGCYFAVFAFCCAIGTAAGGIAGPLTAPDAGPQPQPVTAGR